MNSQPASLHVASDATFDAFIEGERRAVLLDFTATWCGPCQQMSPDLHAFAELYADRVAVVKVDVDDCPGLALRFHTPGMPTLSLLLEGGTVFQLAGERTLGELESMVTAYLSSPVPPPAARHLSTAAKDIDFPADCLATRVFAWDAEGRPVRDATRGIARIAEPLHREAGQRLGVVVSAQLLEAAGRALDFPAAELAKLEAGDVFRLTLMGEMWGDEALSCGLAIGGITELHLRLGPLTDAGIEGLLAAEGLEQLNLDTLTDVQLETLRRGLPGCMINGRYLAAATWDALGDVLPRDSAAAGIPAVQGLLRLREEGNTLTLTLPADTHAFGPDATDGLPLIITSRATGEVVMLAGVPDHLENRPEIALPDIDLSGGIEVRLQVCSGDTCALPQTLWIEPTAR